jgi:DnaK suppressor protein
MLNTDHFKTRLIGKERELLSDLTQLESEARAPVRPDVGDPIDEATSTEIAATSNAESSVEWRMLNLVRGGLRRIDAGSFGRCVDCGRAIEPARLEAVPWTPYCLRDQERHDTA